jgi:hypothetical protein
MCDAPARCPARPPPPAAQTTTAGSEILIFGGHADDINWFRSYNHGSGALWSTEMSSGRWWVAGGGCGAVCTPPWAGDVACRWESGWETKYGKCLRLAAGNPLPIHHLRPRLAEHTPASARCPLLRTPPCPADAALLPLAAPLPPPCAGTPPPAPWPTARCWLWAGWRTAARQVTMWRTCVRWTTPRTRCTTRC